MVSLSPYTCKCCIVFKQFDGLNFDGLAEKRQKRQNSPCQNFTLYDMLGLILCVRILQMKLITHFNEI